MARLLLGIVVVMYPGVLYNGGMFPCGGGGGVYGWGGCDTGGTEKTDGESKELWGVDDGVFEEENVAGTEKADGDSKELCGGEAGVCEEEGVNGMAKGCGDVSASGGISKTRTVGAPALDGLAAGSTDESVFDVSDIRVPHSRQKTESSGTKTPHVEHFIYTIP